MQDGNDGLIAAFDVAADGSVCTLGWEGIDGPVPAGGWRWLHFSRDSARTQAWLLDGGIPPNPVAWALMAEDTRPRFTELDGADVLFLRGINLNEGSEPEDMISLRLFVSETHVIGVSMRELQTVNRLRDAFSAGRGVPCTGAMVERIVQTLRQLVEPELDALEDLIERHELEALGDSAPPTQEMRAAFTDARQDAVMIRRHLVPQAAALRAMVKHQPPWLVSAETMNEEAEAYERVVEDLDSLRERAAVLRDEMSARQAERMNDTMLVLSLISVVFLPITFVTGLLGMNVGGLPLANSPFGFWIISAVMLGIVGFSVLMLRRLWRWQ